MKRMPSPRHTASVPPTVVAPSARWTTQTARSRAPALRADAPAVGETLELRAAEADPDGAIDDADRGRGGTGGAHPLLGRDGHLESLPIGETMRDKRRLQRDDRPAEAQGLGDLTGQAECGIVTAWPPFSLPPVPLPAGPGSLPPSR